VVVVEEVGRKDGLVVAAATVVGLADRVPVAGQAVRAKADANISGAKRFASFAWRRLKP
jgi:hypothetical protein